MSSVSVGAAMRASFAFLGTAWTRAGGILLFLVVVQATAQAVGQAASASRPDLEPLAMLTDLVVFVVATAALGACYRIGLGPDHAGDPALRVGLAGFSWGGVEWRVMGANIVVWVIIAVLAVFALFVSAIAFGVSAATQGFDAKGLQAAAGSAAQMRTFLRIMEGPAGIVSALVAIPCVVGVAVLWAKLALFAVTAADTRSFNFGAAWSLTRGALAALIVTTLAILLAQLSTRVVGGFFGAFLGGILRKSAQDGRFWGGVAGQAVLAAISTPLFAGLQIFVYRTQRGDGGVVQTFA
jgi:hypothetical protein